MDAIGNENIWYMPSVKISQRLFPNTESNLHTAGVEKRRVAKISLNIHTPLGESFYELNREMKFPAFVTFYFQGY
jgi:hypothetical protein